MQNNLLLVIFNRMISNFYTDILAPMQCEFKDAVVVRSVRTMAGYRFKANNDIDKAEKSHCAHQSKKPSLLVF